MEPSQDLLKASAETDADLNDLVERYNWLNDNLPAVKENAINQGDFEKAKTIENLQHEINEVMGTIRNHPFNSRFGQPKTVPQARTGVKNDTGQFAERGSAGHFAGELARPMQKHLMGLHDQKLHGSRGGGLADVIQRQGGVTYNPIRRKQREGPQRGFALSLAKNTEEVIDAPMSREALRSRVKNYVRSHWNEIKAQNNYLGGWRDDKTGKVYLDISTVIDDLEQAKAAARKAQQLAIYDLEKNETIDLAA